MLVLKKLLASVYQVFIFGPRGFFSSSIVSMTAGRDSGSLTTAFSKHYALVKYLLHLIPFYSLAVSVKIRQSREELTRQPEQHHRVVILQPPPSLDGGLDSQSLFLRVWFFNCPTKAMLLYLCNGDSSRALFPKHIRRVSYPSRKYTTGCYMHRFLPLQQFLEENYVCCLLLFYFYNQELHFLHYSEYGTGFVFDGWCSKRDSGIYEAQTVPRCTLGTFASQPKHGSHVIGGFLFLVAHLYFWSASECFNLKLELVNRAMVGRSRLTTIVRGFLFSFL